MAKRPVYQFKISLKHTEPEIWRRIQISDMCSFWDLHVAIQDAMGWLDCHLHQFDVIEPKSGESILIGIPFDDDFDDNPVLPGWDYRVRDYISANSSFSYLYDFGDSWFHLIEYEGSKEKVESKSYPTCLDGEIACPPEDVGSIPGYYNFLEIISDPENDDYESMLDWVGGSYDSKRFDPKKIKFDNPRQRWKRAFE